MKVIWRRRKVW